jgi:NADH-quinone oxidoreductase subunit J
VLVYVGALIALEMTLILRGGFDVGVARAMPPEVARLPNTKALGIEIYTDYLYPLQLAAVLLLVAIIAAIALTLRERKDSRHLDPSRQVRVKRADRVRIVRMDAEVDLPSPAPDAAANPDGGAR